MSQQERWDVVLKVLSGPLAGLGEQVLRGPVVRIGVNPGPGGLQLTGYRGLDARQAVITAYDGGSATIAPVGTNQVRLAPHAHVNWKEIDPISKPQYLNNGCAVHLGPVGRGATIEFVKCQRLGVWAQGTLASEATGLDSGKAAAQGPVVQQGFVQGGTIPTTRVKSVSTSRVPAWFIGCLMTMAFSAAALVGVVVMVVVLNDDIEPIGPTLPGPEEYWLAPPATTREEDIAELKKLGVLDGIEQPYGAFVMEPNAAAAGRDELNNPKNWDQKLFQRVAASVNQLSRWKNVYRRYEEITKEYATVVTMMRKNDLPEIFAAIPIRESNYRPKIASPACAEGWWQFMPEMANRLEKRDGLDFKVRDCVFRDNGVVWNPTGFTPPRDVYANGEYMLNRKCRIGSCKVDDRTDLEKSTGAAAFALGEAFHDPTIKDSGAAVQITIASHNGGYDDARFGVAKKSNMKPAFVAWSKGKSDLEKSKFWGENITCEPGTDQNYCGSSNIHRETQFYVDPILTFHILAVCYYATNHADENAFKTWSIYVQEDRGYCKMFKVPTPQELGL